MLLTVFESSKTFLINMLPVLIMSAKLDSLGLLKIKVFQNSGYDVTIPDYNVTNKILIRESNYIIGLVMWLKFGDCSISMREVIITSILSGFDQKNSVFWEIVSV